MIVVSHGASSGLRSPAATAFTIRARRPPAISRVVVPESITPAHPMDGSRQPGEARSVCITSRSVIVLILLVIAVATWLPRLRGPLDLRWDSGAYYILGTSLAEGKGYRLLNEPGEIEAVQYPPLLPLVVAAYQKLLGTSDPMVVGHWLRVSFLLMFAVYAVASYALLERFLPVPYAFVAVVISLLHLFAMFLSDLLSPELPFALASVLFALCNGKRVARLYPALAGVLAVVAYLLRTAGVALLVAWVGESLLQRDLKRAAVRCVVAALPIVGWQTYVAHVQATPAYSHPSYPYQRADYLFYNVSYASNLSLRDPLRPELGRASRADVLHRVLGNLTRIPRSLGEAISADRGYWRGLLLRRLLSFQVFREEPSDYAVATVLLSALGALIIGGLALQLARRQWMTALYVIAYVGVVSLTPWPSQWMRYWWPLTPFLLLALLQCCLALRDALSSLLPRPVGRVVAYFPAALLCGLLLIESLTIVDSYREARGEVVWLDQKGRPVQFTLFFYDQDYRELDGALTWLRARARPDDTIAVAMPHWAYLVTHAKAVMPPFESDPARTQALLDAVPVRYVVVDTTAIEISRLMRRSLSRVFSTFPARWKEVYGGPASRVSIYERQTERVR